MREFVDAALGFPAALFTFLLVVVVAYWLFVLLGALDVDALDADAVEADPGEPDAVPDGLGGILAAAGLDGAPVTVVLSVLIAVAWFLSLTGEAILDAVPLATSVHGVLSVAVVPLALAGAWLATRALLLPLRRLLPARREASRVDFVGRVCVVRTGLVCRDFGQAEVTAADGSSALIQVRLAGDATLSAGWPALIYDYDPAGEFFWITPVDDTLGSKEAH